MTDQRARTRPASALLALLLFAALAVNATPSNSAKSRSFHAAAISSNFVPGGLTVLLAGAGGASPVSFEVMSPQDVSAALGARPRRFSAFRTEGAVDSRRLLLRSLPFGPILAAAGDRNHVDSLLLAAMVEAESQFAPRAVSPCGAVGLMQLLPATGREYGARDLLDPYANIDAGSRYLRALLDRFKERPMLAIAAYNTGPEVVARYGCVPPFRETQDFVKRVVASYAQHCRDLGDVPADAELQLLAPVAQLAATAVAHAHRNL
jgi:soluble lytic murein transglycosylase-like protein